jgi:RecJ-like exonuclease
MQQGWGKPVIGVSFGDAGTIKVSGRASKSSVARGLNLGELMKNATGAVGGIGGGHRMAAGASIPKEKINEFLLFAGEYLGKQGGGSYDENRKAPKKV